MILTGVPRGQIRGVPETRMLLFKILGVLVGLYAVSAAIKGEVYARSGLWGRTVSMVESPIYFWVVIASYAVLSVALLTIF